MSEFKDAFVEAYRSDIVSMLDLAEELPLFHSPDITVKGHLDTNNIDISTADKSLADQDLATEAGIQARTDAAIGLSHLHGLGALATMKLFASELRMALPASTTEYTAVQEKLADSIVQRARDQIYSAYHTYASYHFVNHESGETIEVSNAHLKSNTTAVFARDLNLNISDAFISKGVKISELPVSFDGKTTLDISQTIRPAEDETLRVAAELFYDNGSPADMTVILSLFVAELTGHGDVSDEVESMLGRYEASDQLAKLKRIVEEIKQKAAAAKMNSAFSLASPEMTLPTATELEEYMLLMSRIRS